jgi:hypothetical protein
MTTEELAIQAQRTEDRSKSNTHRIEKLENRQKDFDGIIAAVGRIDEKVDIFNKNINEKVDVLVDRLGKENGEIKAQVDKTDGKVQHLLDKSGKRWDSIVEKALLTVVAAVVAYMLSKVGF